MAIAVALLFKVFILEISKIPSGSMQPTLMGNPETGVFDRVLVDKLSMHFRDPKRFEVVVFKHPLERSRIMVKRLVGMPGEELRIAHGDLWTRPDTNSEWTILRRPPAVQDEIWKPLDLDDPPRSSWKVVGGGELWRTRGRDIDAKGAGRVQFRADTQVRDKYLDGYPDTLRGKIKQYNPNTGQEYVGDLRVTGDVRPDDEVTGFNVVLTEGRRRYEFHIPGPAAPEGDEATVRMVDGEPDSIPVLKTVPFRLRGGRSVSFAAENLDDRLTLEVDGDVLATLDVPFLARQEATIFLELEGAGGELEDLQVYRDIYYLPDSSRAKTWEVSIPEGHYVMLGDNTQDSADGRDWRSIRYAWTDDEGSETQVKGNFRRQGENPSPATGPNDEAYYRFRDVWGERHWFAKADALPDIDVPHKTVPRELIQGRAVAIFWPIKPHRGLWRLAWLP